MKKIYIIITFILCVTLVHAQQQSFDALKADYPLLMKKFGKELDVRCGLEEYSDCYVVGYDVMQMKDDETIGDIKKRVRDILKQNGWHGGDIRDIKLIKDQGYN